jgi:hypothetical protein
MDSASSTSSSLNRLMIAATRFRVAPCIDVAPGDLERPLEEQITLVIIDVFAGSCLQGVRESFLSAD